MDLKERQDFYKDNNLLLLDNKDGGTRIKHKCKGAGGYLYYLSIQDVIRQHSHSIVSKYNIYSIYNVQQFIYNSGSKTQVISKQYVSNKNKIKLKCECGREYTSPWNRIWNLKKVRCNHCGYKYITDTQRTTVEDLEKEVAEYGYHLVKGVEQKSKSLTIENEMGETFHTTIHSIRMGHMPSSKYKSGLEIAVEKYLKKNKLKYVKQKTFPKCKYKSLLRFDFYLPKFRVCIEVNGKQHYEPIDWYGGEEKFKTQQIRDNIKKDFCKNNNIKLIEIPYYEFNKTNNYKEYINELIKEPI